MESSQKANAAIAIIMAQVSRREILGKIILEISWDYVVFRKCGGGNMEYENSDEILGNYRWFL